MNETAMEVLGKARTRKQPWMTQDILNACDKRRELKAKRFIDSDKEKEYRNANIKVRKEIKKAKEEFLEQKCQEIQQGFEENNSKKAFDTIKQLNRKKSTKQPGIEDANGNLLTENSKIQERWTQYVKELYNYILETSTMQTNLALQEEKLSVLKEEQAGFCEGRSTAEQICNVRILGEKFRDHQRELHHNFIDFKKAFDRVWRKALWYTMKKHNISFHLVHLIEALYDEATNAVISDGRALKWFRTTVGVRQRCILSPMLFNLFLEQIMLEAMENFEGTVSVAGQKVSNLRFADDIDLIAGNSEELSNITERLEKHAKK
nr:uncharacterized protein LOC113800258 [Penaeus vannamei]